MMTHSPNGNGEFRDGENVAGNPPEVHEILEKLAEAGVVTAQGILSQMYRDGDDGAPRDLERSIYWLRMAAEQGSAWAQFTLGKRYERGEGVLQDDEKASEWFQRAVRQEPVAAHYNLDVLGELKLQLSQSFIEGFKENSKHFQDTDRLARIDAKEKLGEGT